MAQQIQFKRSNQVFNTRQDAINQLNSMSHLPGQPTIIRYLDGSEVKTILAIGVDGGRCDIMPDDYEHYNSTLSAHTVEIIDDFGTVGGMPVATNARASLMSNVDKSNPEDVSLVTETLTEEKATKSVKVVSDSTTPEIDVENNKQYYFGIISSITIGLSPFFTEDCLSYIEFTTGSTLPSIILDADDDIRGFEEYKILTNSRVSLFIQGNIITCSSVKIN